MSNISVNWQQESKMKLSHLHSTEMLKIFTFEAYFRFDRDGMIE